MPRKYNNSDTAPSCSVCMASNHSCSRIALFFAFGSSFLLSKYEPSHQRLDSASLDVQVEIQSISMIDCSWTYKLLDLLHLETTSKEIPDHDRLKTAVVKITKRTQLRK